MAMTCSQEMSKTMTIYDRGITFPVGFKAAAVRAGLKSKNLDLVAIVSETQAAAAGVFTQNLAQAASVGYSKKIVQGGYARAILCNAGNANACTGPQGEKDNQEMANLFVEAFSSNPPTLQPSNPPTLDLIADEVLVASTGVIGRPMPMDKLRAAIPLLAEKISHGESQDSEVASAIMTTDLKPKQIAVELYSEDWEAPIRIGGVAKGSGMIAPNMATTLCFITTDADVEPGPLQSALTAAIDKTFNRITVDGDTSTNDMCLFLANGASGVKIEAGDPLFQAGLHFVCGHLAKEVARDGEGATKLVAVTVSGTETEADAAKLAKTIAESPLVKTALFGCDPNWGRIVAAAGRAGIAFDPNQAAVWLGEHQTFGNGAGLTFDKNKVHDYLKNPEVDLIVNVGEGAGKATVWTCDYSYDYIRINAEYHT